MMMPGVKLVGGNVDVVKSASDMYMSVIGLLCFCYFTVQLQLQKLYNWVGSEGLVGGRTLQ